MTQRDDIRPDATMTILGSNGQPCILCEADDVPVRVEVDRAGSVIVLVAVCASCAATTLTEGQTVGALLDRVHAAWVNGGGRVMNGFRSVLPLSGSYGDFTWDVLVRLFAIQAQLSASGILLALEEDSEELSRIRQLICTAGLQVDALIEVIDHSTCGFTPKTEEPCTAGAGKGGVHGK